MVNFSTRLMIKANINFCEGVFVSERFKHSPLGRVKQPLGLGSQHLATVSVMGLSMRGAGYLNVSIIPSSTVTSVCVLICVS